MQIKIYIFPLQSNSADSQRFSTNHLFSALSLLIPLNSIIRFFYFPVISKFEPGAIFMVAPLLSVRLKQVLLMPVMVGKNETPVLTTTFEQTNGTEPKLQLFAVPQSAVFPSQMLFGASFEPIRIKYLKNHPIHYLVVWKHWITKCHYPNNPHH